MTIGLLEIGHLVGVFLLTRSPFLKVLIFLPIATTVPATSAPKFGCLGVSMPVDNRSSQKKRQLV